MREKVVGRKEGGNEKGREEKGTGSKSSTPLLMTTAPIPPLAPPTYRSLFLITL